MFAGQTSGPGGLGLAMTSGNIGPVPAAAAVAGLVPVWGPGLRATIAQCALVPAVSRALVPGLDQDPLLFVTTDNVRRCGDRGDTSELELQRSLESDANMWQTDIMKNLQLIFSVYLLSEVVSMIDKRVINNKNSENNEGINDFMYFLVVSLKTMTTYFPVGIIYRIIKRQ